MSDDRRTCEHCHRSGLHAWERPVTKEMFDEVRGTPGARAEAQIAIERETPHWLRTDGSFGRRLDAVKDRWRAGDSVAALALDYDLSVAQILEMLAHGDGYDIVEPQSWEGRQKG